MATSTTRDRILDAAEDLFAEQGFSTSVRAITGSAEANLAAVHYHFGSKEELIEEVFARRLRPLNAERLRLLDEIEAMEPEPPDWLERIVEAFLGPALRLSHDPRGAVFMRLYGHTLSQRDDRMFRMLRGQFSDVIERFNAALGHALPELPPVEVFWRFMFMVGAMAHTMALSDKLQTVSDGAFEAADVEETLQRLVPFVAGGMRAEPPAPGGAR